MELKSEIANPSDRDGCEMEVEEKIWGEYKLKSKRKVFENLEGAKMNSVRLKSIRFKSLTRNI